MKLIIVPLTAILCVAGLLAYALYLGIDGALFGIGATIIGGLAGYESKALRDKIKRPK